MQLIIDTPFNLPDTWVSSFYSLSASCFFVGGFQFYLPYRYSSILNLLINLCGFMDLSLLDKGLAYTKKKQRWVIALGALGFTVCGAYRVYNSPFVVKKRKSLSKLLSAIDSLADSVNDSAEAIGVLSNDLKNFLGSDSDQVPQSLKQVSKIACSDEFSDSLSRITRALIVGVLRGYGDESGNGSGFPDRFIDKLFTEEGSGFVSVIVGSFSRNLVMALYSEWRDDHTKQSSNVPNWVEFVSDDKCRELIADMVRAIVSTAVAVYLDKTMNINPYNDLFSSMTNPKHEAKVRETLVLLCSNAVETFVRTSHYVSNASGKLGFEDGDEKSSIRAKLIPARRLGIKNQDGGWGRSLAVPTNRKLVLDMTAVVTFQSVRSFLEFLLQRISECMKRNVDAVQQEVVERGVEAVRYATAKSSAVTSLCLTLCLNIVDSPWNFVPS